LAIYLESKPGKGPEDGSYPSGLAEVVKIEPLFSMELTQEIEQRLTSI